MTDKIEILGKKAANKTIVVMCYGANITAGAIEFTAQVGGLACWLVENGARIAKNTAWDVVENGGIFEIDEDELKEKAEVILEQY